MSTTYTDRAEATIDIAYTMSHNGEGCPANSLHLFHSLLLQDQARGVPTECIALYVLDGLGVKANEVLPLIHRHYERVDMQNPRDSDLIEGFLHGARAEADQLGDKHVGTEHLLLSLAKHPDCSAMLLCIAIGVTPQHITAAVHGLRNGLQSAEKISDDEEIDEAEGAMKFALDLCGTTPQARNILMTAVRRGRISVQSLLEAMAIYEVD